MKNLRSFAKKHRNRKLALIKTIYNEIDDQKHMVIVLKIKKHQRLKPVGNPF